MRSDNPIIAQERTPVNSDSSLTPKDVARLRGQARKRVACDPALSPGCGNVYTVLDDWGRSSGITPALTEARIAEEVCRSERSVRTWLRELEGRGYVQRRRVQRGFEYTVRWTSAPVSAPADPAKFAETKPAIRQSLPPVPAKFAETELQAMPRPHIPRHCKEAVGGWVTAALPEKRPPARSTKAEALGVKLRQLGYTPDAALLERLAQLIPRDCSADAAAAVLQRRITRPHSKALTQPMLPVFFAEDVPVKWEAEAAILEAAEADRERASEQDRQQQIEAQGILDRGITDPIEREWALAILGIQPALVAVSA